MSIRSSQLYISRETRRLLSVIAQAEGGESTADSVGERCLSEHLTTRYPALVALQKDIKAVEEKMIAAVREGK